MLAWIVGGVVAFVLSGVAMVGCARTNQGASSDIGNAQGSTPAVITDSGSHVHSPSGQSNQPTGLAVRDKDGLWRWPVGIDAIEISAFAPDDEPTDQHRRAAEAFVARTRELSVQFMDPEAARAAGYTPHPAFAEDHWVNEALLNDDDVLNPSRPEFVMFDPDTNEFLGVMFVAPWGTHGTQLAGPLSRWHYHDAPEGCWKGQMPLASQDSPPATCPPGYVKRKGPPEMLHVWFRDTPDGPMATYMTIGA